MMIGAEYLVFLEMSYRTTKLSGPVHQFVLLGRAFCLISSHLLLHIVPTFGSSRMGPRRPPPACREVVDVVRSVFSDRLLASTKMRDASESVVAYGGEMCQILCRKGGVGGEKAGATGDLTGRLRSKIEAKLAQMIALLHCAKQPRRLLVPAFPH